MKKTRTTRQGIRMGTRGFALALATFMAAPDASAVRQLIGDVDGFGFSPTTGLVRASGLPRNKPADVDGDGIIEPGEFLPDLDKRGSVRVNSDEFDNRSPSEAAASNGAQLTDFALSGRGTANGSTFTFNFTVPSPGDADFGQDHFINFVFGDYDVFPARLDIDGIIVNLTLQSGNADGLVQRAHAIVPWSKMTDGQVVIKVIAPGEPYLAFDFALLDTEQLVDLPPTAKCQDVVVNNDPGLCTANVPVASIDNGSFDPEDGSVTLSVDPAGPYPVGVTTVTLTATDSKGNSDTCTATVTVIDAEAPTLNLPGNLVAGNTTGRCDATVNFTISATDNCPGSLVVTSSHNSGDVFPLGTTTVNVTATDGAGNSVSGSFTVTVNDTEPPVIAALPNLTVGNDPGRCDAAVFYAPSATDNCGLQSITSSPPSGTVFSVGTTTVTVNATDVHGNSSTGTFTVTVEDREPPTISPSASDLTVECDGTGNLTDLNAWLASNGGASATDNCSGVTWSHNFTALTPLCGGTGEATVTFTATDAAGNASSTTATFRIIDTTPPILAWSVNGTAATSGSTVCITPNAVPITVTVTATDLCGQAFVNPLTVTCHAINGAGKVIDKSGSCEVTVNGSTATVTDSGGVGTFITITGSAIDECGNATGNESIVLEVKNPGQGGNKSKGNEGVGNGVDPNTPGHDHNGGNDDPGNGPGNPGAKNKNR